MSDAVSSIQFAINTQEGFENLQALRREFKGLKDEIIELNQLKANPQVSGSLLAAHKEISSLGGALEAATGRISELEAQLRALGKVQVTTAKETANAVKQSVEDQAKAVVGSEKRQASEILAIEKGLTKNLEEEARKRASFGSSAKAPGGRIGFSESLDPEIAKTRIIESMLAQQRKLLEQNAAERAALEVKAQADHEAMLRAGELNDIATIQELLRKHEEYQSKKAALEAQGNALQAQMLLEGAIKDQAYIDAKLAAHQTFQEVRAAQQLAEREQHDLDLLAMLVADETYIQNKLAAHTTFQEVRAAQQLAEREQHAQALLHEAISDTEYIQNKLRAHEEFQAAKAAMDFEERSQHAQNLLHEAVADEQYIQAKLVEHEAFQAKRAVQDFEERQQHAQNLLHELVNEEQYIQEKLRLHAEFQANRAKIERDGQLEHAQMMFQGLLNDQVAMQNAAEAQTALRRKQLVQDNNFNTSGLGTQVPIVRRAAGLVGNGSDAERVALAKELYGPAAVAAVEKLGEMEAKLALARKQGGAAIKGQGLDLKELHEHNKMVAAGMKDLHSSIKGLTEGLNQLWTTWGSMVPLVAAAAITGAMLKILEVGKDVEYQLNFLVALTKKEPVDLDKFIHITETSMESVKDAAAGVRALAQTGLNARDALIALPDVLNLATIGEMSVGQAALSAAGTMHAFGLSVNKVAHVGDVFSVIASTTNTSVGKLTESMRQASTVGDMFKVGLEETAASLGILAQRNILGGQAGTALSTALKNLYEPSEKARKTLEKLGVDSSDGHGGLKNYTVLIGELRDKLMGLNEFDRMQILGTITDQRAAKALSAIISNFGDYEKALDKAKNSTDFMMQTTLRLEDTVQGGWRRMGNALEGSYMKAFTKAEPAIRGLQFELAKLAGSEDTISFFTKLIVAGVDLTRTLYDHAKAIAYAAAGYVALRAISTISSLWVSYRINVLRSTLAVELNTVAGKQNALAMEAQSLAATAAGVGMARFANGARLASLALGPVAAVLTILSIGYEIYKARVDESENAQVKANNTIQTAISFYQRQIDKLRELNEELRKNSKEGKEAEGQTIRTIALAQLKSAQTRVENAEKASKNAPTNISPGAFTPGGVSGRPGGYAGGSGSKEDLNLAKAREALALAVKNVDDLNKTAYEYHVEKKDNVKLLDRESVVRDLKSLVQAAAGGDDSSDHGRKLGTEKSRALLEGKDGLDEMLKRAQASEVYYKQIMPLLPDLHKKVNEALGTMKPDHGGNAAANDAYRAEMTRLDGKAQKVKDDEKSELAGIKSMAARGEISDLEAVYQSLVVTTKARKDDLNIFKEKEDFAAKHENRKADGQAAKNKEEQNKRADVEAENEASRQIAEIKTKWNQEDLKAQAQTLKDKGELYKAYITEFGAQHDLEMHKLDLTINSKDPMVKDEDKDAARKRKGFLKTQYDAGGDSAQFDEDLSKVQEKFAQLQEKLAAVAEKSARTNESARSPGFISDLTAAGKGDDLRAETSASVQGLLKNMQELAEKSNNPKMKATVAKMGADLVKEANRSRDAWIAAGKSIEKSLGDSFGKGGKAVGGIISSLIKQRETQKAIDDDLKKAKADKDNQDPLKQIELENQARSESAQLQLSSYGDIAGAAKGFFDEHSKGYAMMQTAERVFRAFEMAESVRNFVVKSGLLESFTALFATSKATEVGLTEATVAPTVAAEGVKQGAFSISALAGALALPFPANLPAFAIVAAMLASIGLAVAGGGGASTGPSLSEQRQKYAGTGYTYDQDSKNNPYDWELQKSESLGKSLERMKDNSDIALRYSSSQLSTLERINDGISGMASMVVRSTGLRGTRADELALGVGSSKSFASFSKSSTTLDDSGISFGPTSKSLSFLGMNFPVGGSTQGQMQGQTVGSVLDNGVNAHSYADTTTKNSSFWGLSSSSDKNTTYGNLESDLNEGMSQVVKEMYSSILDSAKFLGKDSKGLESLLQGTTLKEAGLDKISFKGMSTDEVEKTLNAAFSKLGDVMAEKAMPEMKAFKHSSEDYLETLVRVSGGVDSAQYSLQRLGVEMVNYNLVLNKQGDVATEIIRTSLTAKEVTRTQVASAGSVLDKIFGHFGSGATVFEEKLTGIGEIVQNFSGTASDLTDTYTKLVSVRNTMRVTGMENADVTTSMVRGAGGLDNLSSGMNDFLDNFFTDAEKAAAKITLLQEEFTKIGKPMPRSKDEFKSLAQSIDRTTEAGQTLYGALIALSSQFNDVADSSGTVNPALAKQKGLVSGLVETAKRWLDIMGTAKGMVSELDDAMDKTGKSDKTARIKELQDLLNSGVGSFEQQLEIAGQLKDLVLEKYQTEKDNAEKMISFSKEMRNYVSDLKTGDMSPLTTFGKLQEAISNYRTVLENASSDDTTVRDDARGQIQDKASSLLDLAHTYYASSQTYADIFEEVTGQLDKLGLDSGNAGLSLQSLGEGQLSELQKLRDLASSIEAATQSEYDSSVKQLERQVGLMENMDGSLTMLTQLFADMPAQLAMQLGNNGTSLPGYASSNNTAQDQIESMYSSILHRQADTGGMQYWMSKYQSGQISMDDIRSSILNSPEAKDMIINGSHATGLDYVPFDGYVAELHRGERVLTETQARRTDKAAMGSTASFSDSEKAEMAAEIAELRKAMDRMAEAQMEAAKAMARAFGQASDDAAEKIVQGTKDAIHSSDFDNRSKPAFQ